MNMMMTFCAFDDKDFYWFWWWWCYWYFSRISRNFVIYKQQGCCIKWFFSWTRSAHRWILVIAHYRISHMFVIPKQRSCCIQEMIFLVFMGSKLLYMRFSDRGITEFHPFLQFLCNEIAYLLPEAANYLQKQRPTFFL